ncbi:MAG: hypothetical protein J7M25_17730 [Deltaproteobacteria bacterium]|nr:hypothetical protein [Deltaproteobacteria bacterium]
MEHRTGAPRLPVGVAAAIGVSWLLGTLLLLIMALADRQTTGYAGMELGGGEQGQGGSVVTRVAKNSPAWQVGVRAGWRLLSIAGRPVMPSVYRHPVAVRDRQSLELWRSWHRHLRTVARPGQTIRFVFVLSDGSRRMVVFSMRRTPIAIIFKTGLLPILVGLIFGILGLLLVLRRPELLVARKLLWFSLLLEGFFFSEVLTEFPVVAVASRGTLWLSQGVGDLLFDLAAAAMLDFTLSFLYPTRSWRRWGGAAVYVLGGLVAFAYGRRFLLPFTFLFAPGVYALGMILLVANYLRQKLPLQRKRIKWLVWGGGVPVTLLAVIYALVTFGMPVNETFAAALMTLSTLTFPIATMMAIRQDRLFDVDLVVRRSLLAALLLPVLVLGYSRLVSVLGGAIGAWASPEFLLVVGLVLVMLLPGQVRFEELLDRLLGRNRFGPIQQLSSLAGELMPLDDIDAVAAHVSDRIMENLDIERVGFYVIDFDEKRLMPRAFGPWQEEPAPLAATFLTRFEDRPLFVAEEVEGQAAADLGIPSPDVLVAMTAGTRNLGMLSVGSGGRKWSRAAIDGLSVATAAAVAALDRIRHRQMFRRIQDMQAQIIHSGRLAALGTLAAGLAHELNTPLGYIKANAQLVRRKLDETGADSNLVELVSDVEQGAKQMHEVVANLRSFSQVDRDGLALVDLNESVRQSVKMLAPAVPSGVTIAMELEEVPPIAGKQAQLNQMVVNLVSNACDVSPKASTVTVRTRKDVGFVVLTVHDEGPGIAPDIRARLFDPFFTTKPPGKGMGLGLAITRTIVESHGGTLVVDNAPSGGAEAMVRLPLKGVFEEEEDDTIHREHSGGG